MDEPLGGNASWQDDIQKLIAIFDGEANFDAAFGAIDIVISQGFEENFYNTLDDNAQVWAPRKDNKPHPLLIKTGKMFAAATDPQNPGHLFRREGDEIEIGVKAEAVFYAWFHHVGTQWGPTETARHGRTGTKMVARRFAYANDTTIQRAMDAFGDEINKLVEAI